ncbi:hypothetical protein [Streptomyces sp. NPDC093591]|uniref:hypothetical protein n=1 Tax=Streptomyces sp. NPDC093591 TaxID=3366044 RepID=UPI00382322B1
MIPTSNFAREARARPARAGREPVAKTAPEEAEARHQAAQAELDLARDLRAALKAGRVKYMLVKRNSDEAKKTHEGYLMKEYDIRLPERDEDDPDSAS